MARPERRAVVSRGQGRRETVNTRTSLDERCLREKEVGLIVTGNRFLVT